MNKTDFPILSTTVYNKPLVYLDNAATTQKPQAVLDAIIEGYTQWNANIHRGVHHLSQVATQHHEAARQRVADFLGAASANEIIFTKGTTDSINLLAYCVGESMIQEGDEIIVSQMEHHSNIVPWQMVCERKKAVLKVIPLHDDLSLNIEALPTLITKKTKFIAVAHVSNVLGIINPIKEVITLAHEHHIPVLVDGAQSAPHIPVNVQDFDCDFFVCSAHKMYGPTGVGILYGKEQWLNTLPPAEGGGEMIEHVSFAKTTYNTLPYKFEAGTPNYIGSHAFASALDYMTAIGMDTIEAHEKELVAYAEEALSKIPEVKIYAAGLPKAGAISFNVLSINSTLSTLHSIIHPFDIGTLLDHQGVAVRTGHHCAEPLIDYLGVPGTVRISFGLYNTKEEVDTFIKALQKAIMMLG